MKINLLNNNNQEKLIEKNYKKNYITLIEKKFLKDSKSFEEKINIGDIIKIGYSIPEGEKERTQYYEGLIIAKKNRGLNQSFTLRRMIQGVGVEQIFLTHSPKILSILKKKSLKIRRAKLYFTRLTNSLKGKLIKNK